MFLVGKSAVVVGLGASGIAAARLCARRGARVTALDAKAKDALSPEALALEGEGIALAVGSNDAADLTKADVVVVSPGVPSFAGLEAAERTHVPIWGEVELATRCMLHPAPIVAVGGTNGKSTTTTLVGELLAEGGKQVFVGGNLGEPLSSHADERFDLVALEVSSFQMERVDKFHPRVGILLNITDDHLDRYPSFDAYAQAKGNCFVRQEADDVAVVPFGDALALREAKRGRGRLVTFGPGGDVDVTADAIIHRPSGATFARKDIALQGGHNALNVAASLAAVMPLGVSEAWARGVLASFRGLAHRMVLVADVRGVRYYDDSKGTNVGAVVTALAGIVEPKAVLIAGGRDKGGSYAPIVDSLRKKGRAAVLIGEAAPLLAEAIGDAVPVVRAASMDEAVRRAAELAQPGDAVLMSPACSSYDMFRDYKHRGDEFVASVHRLRGDA